MKLACVISLLSVLVISCLSCALRPPANGQGPWEVMKHVDLPPYHAETVVVEEVARNLHDRQMYNDLRKILYYYEGASLSLSTVKILKSELDDHSREIAANDVSEDIRVRAVALLGLSRHPKAIPIVTHFMFHDPAWRVRGSAACALSRLKGEEALPALLKALNEGKISKLNSAFLFVGEKAVPYLIRWMEEDFANSGGQNHAVTHISHLELTADRRAIEPLIRVLAHPSSPSDPLIDEVRSTAALTLAHFASEELYTDHLAWFRPKTRVVPTRGRERIEVRASDRKRIIEALQDAGYDIDSLLYPFYRLDEDGNIVSPGFNLGIDSLE